MSKKNNTNSVKNVKAKKKLDPKTRTMLVIFAIAAVGIVFLAVLGLKSSILTPQRSDGSRIDIESIKAVPITIRSSEQGSSSFSGVYFTPIGNMVFDQVKSSETSAYYSNAETGATMNISIKDEADSYMQIQEFTDFATEVNSTSPIEMVRFAFAQDISNVNLLSSFADIKHAGEIQKICGMYVASNDFRFSEINGDLYGAMTYTIPNAYGIDIVHEGKLYTINFRGTELEPITLDMVIAFLQTVVFKG